MRRISTTTKVVDKFGSGKHGFTNGNAVGGIAATDLEDVWFDHVQEEIANTIEALGVALDPNNRSQLLAVIRTFASQGGHGQCRLSVASGTQLKLAPYNGNNVLVNGAPLQLPQAGVTVSNASLAASTVYYVYLAGNTALPVLNLSTTGHVPGSGGIEVKSGDATQTLVGMIATNASSQFADSAAQRFCLNWFNRRMIAGNFIQNGVAQNFTNTAIAELNTAWRVAFLVWGDESVYGGIDGECIPPAVSGASVGLQAYMDGAVFGPLSAVLTPSATVGGSTNVSNNAALLTEGLHTLQVYGSVTTGTGQVVNIANKILIRG